MIKRDGPVAPWRQLAALIEDQIRSGQLAPGDRVPSIDTLRQEYDLAYTTVQKAIAYLKEQGLVITSPMGTFVAGS